MGWIGFWTLLKREIVRFVIVPTQTIVPPIMSSVLFILIFGVFLKDNVSTVSGTNFMMFFIPGLIAMNLVTTSYSNSAFSLFLMRFMGYIRDIQVAPLSYFEIALALNLGSVIRGIFIALLIFIVSLFFANTPIANPLLFAYFLITSAMFFSSIGLIAALVAEEFEHLEILTVFVITPLTFLGGVFHSVANLPEIGRQLTMLNPIFYMIDGLRYSMLGASEGNILLSIALCLVFSVVFFSINVWLFRSGYKLRS